MIILIAFIILLRAFGASESQLNKRDLWSYYKNGTNYYNSGVRLFQPPDPSSHKCLKEIELIYVEHDKKHDVLGPGRNRYYGIIEVCCEGYKRSEFNWDECVPKCQHKCLHGTCIEPDVCKCYPNYVKSHEDKCVLTCPVFCLNGKCRQDGTCHCNDGYEIDESQSYCKPICEGQYRCLAQDNQYCSAPNVCSCIKDYKLTGSGCEPICEHNCGINGNCYAPNKCGCKDQTYKIIDGLCQEECYQSCRNGLCVSRNRCICFKEFTYDERTTSCIPESINNYEIENY